MGLDVEALQLVERLRAGVDWQVRQIRIMGKAVDQPRLVAYMGDDGCSYRYR